jgi:hypothetical protein
MGNAWAEQYLSIMASITTNVDIGLMAVQRAVQHAMLGSDPSSFLRQHDSLATRIKMYIQLEKKPHQ